MSAEDVTGYVWSLQYQIDNLRKEVNAKSPRRSAGLSAEDLKKRDALEAQRHDDILRLLAHHTEMIQWIGRRLEAMGPAGSPVGQIPGPAAKTAPAATPAGATSSARTISDRSLNTIPKASSPVSSDRLVAFSLAFSVLSFVAMLIFMTRMRRRERELRRMVVTSDVEAIRADMRRFSEKVSNDSRPRLKISINGQNIDLVNVGNAAAQDLKLLIGSNPSSLKKRIITENQINEGERVSVLLPPRTTDDPIHATLEYRNAATDRSYKDQFILKTDRLTGLLMPIQEAS